MSGGSDFHGTAKINHFLGVGNNNLNTYMVTKEGYYFVEASKATNFSREGNVTNFSVVLTATSQPRIVHLLLNYVDDSVSDLGLEYEHENNLIGSMVVSGDRDVYWQRVEVPGGINEASNEKVIKG